MTQDAFSFVKPGWDTTHTPFDLAAFYLCHFGFVFVYCIWILYLCNIYSCVILVSFLYFTFGLHYPPKLNEEGHAENFAIEDRECRHGGEDDEEDGEEHDEEHDEEDGEEDGEEEHKPVEEGGEDPG